LHVLAALQQRDDPRLRRLARRRQRLAREAGGQQPHLLHDPLRRHRVRLREGGVDERVQVVVELLRGGLVAGDERVVEVGDGARREVRHAAEVTAAAERQHRVAEQLDPRQRDEVAAALVEHVGDVLEVARRLLDADDVLVRARQPADRRGRDLDGRPHGDVVDDDRQVGELVRDARVPLEQALLLGAPVVRRHDQRGGRAEALRLGRQLERLAHQRGAGAGQERDAPVDRGGRGPHHLDPLRDRLRRRLAGRAAHRDAVRAVLELPVYERRDRVEIERAVGVERGDQRGDRAAHRVWVRCKGRHDWLLSGWDGGWGAARRPSSQASYSGRRGVESG
jgi:hypothetical protein